MPGRKNYSIDPTVGLANATLTKDRRSAKAEELAQAMIDCVHNIGKRGKQKPSRFSEYLLQQAEQLRQSINNGGTQDPMELGNRSLQEIRRMVQELDAAHMSSSQTRQASEVLRPFVDGVTRYAKVVDTMVQSNPVVSALIWGGARFILQIAQDYSENFAMLTQLLEDLGPMLDDLGTLYQTFDWYDKIMNRVLQSYQIILEILDSAATEYGQKGRKTLLMGIIRPPGRKRKALMDQLTKQMAELSNGTVFAMSIVQRKIVDKEQESDERKMRNGIDKWLQAPREDTTYDQCIQTRCAGTGEWPFKDQKYQNWESFTQSRIRENKQSQDRLDRLWINGPPGIGKTFLAASLIRRLEMKDQVVVHYFFRDDSSGSRPRNGQPERRKGEAITFLRYIARQLVDILQRKDSPGLPKGFRDIYYRLGQTGYLEDISLAVEIVQTLLNALPRVHIVIDGLDECSDRYAAMTLDTDIAVPTPSKSHRKFRLPRILDDLCSFNYLGVVKWAFTSCIEAQLTTLFSKVLQSQCLTVTQENTREDVMTFIEDFYDRELQSATEEPFSDPESLELGRVRCMSMVNFLDARLTMSILAREGVTCKEEIIQALEGYHLGFNARYMRGLRVVAERSQQERTLVRKILAFVSVAERPLTVNELLEGLGAASSTPPELFSPYTDRHRPHRSKLEELLPPLLELDATQSVVNPTVRFIHRTAREFVSQNVNEIQNCPEACKPFFMTSLERNVLVGLACLTYICYHRGGDEGRHKVAPETLEQALANDDRDYAFFKYACIFWYRHLDPHYEDKTVDIPGTLANIFPGIDEFMRSPHFLTCLWVQSLYAPYLISSYASHKGGLVYTLNDPNVVYNGPGSLYQSCGSSPAYADPLPGWLARVNEKGAKLAQDGGLLIREFGLVLLRSKGGIRNFHPACLGKRHCTRDSWPHEDRWKAIALEKKKSVRLISQSTNASGSDERSQHMMTIISCSSDTISARCLVVNCKESSVMVDVRDWVIRLNGQSKPGKTKATILGEIDLTYETSSTLRVPKCDKAPVGFWSSTNTDTESIFTGDPDSDVLRVCLQTNRIMELGCGVPMAVLSGLCAGSSAEMDGWIFQDRRSDSSADGKIVAVVHRWMNEGGTHKCHRRVRQKVKQKGSRRRRARTRKSRGSTFKANSLRDSSSADDESTDSHSDSSTDSDSDSELDDSGYSSAGSTSHYTSSTPDSIRGYASLAIVSRTMAIGNPDTCAKNTWYHFPTTKIPLRQSPPAVHPSGYYVIFALDGARTAIINTVTGQVKELHSKLRTKVALPVAIVYHFTPSSPTNSKPLLHRLTASKDLSQNFKWHVDLDLLEFPGVTKGRDCGDSIDIDQLGAFKEVATARVTWIAPYDNPHEGSTYAALPFTFTWDETHLNLVFGACEVHVCRIGLIPNSRMKMETTNAIVTPLSNASLGNFPTFTGQQSSDSDSDSCGGTDSEDSHDGNHEVELAKSFGMDSEDTSMSMLAPGPPSPLTVYIPYSNCPIFLPASTTHRSFTFHAPEISSIQYALFSIASTNNLPAVLIFKEVEKDLGGWVSLEGKPNVYLGRGATADGDLQEHTEDDRNMSEKFWGNGVTYNVAIRSGMEWKSRFELICGSF